MNITFLVNHDPAANLALNYLLPKLQHHKNTVFYTHKPVQSKTVPARLSDLAAFEKSLLHSTRGWMTFADLHAEQLNAINHETDLARFQASCPDLAISIRHMSILGSAAIATPKQGVINLHSGILPDYKGVMACFWAMSNGSAKLGTTLHYIDDARIDTGRILSQSSTPTDFDKSYFWNVLNVYRAGCDNVLDAVARLENQAALTASPQLENGCYYSYPSDAEITKAQFELYDPSDSIAAFL